MKRPYFIDPIKDTCIARNGERCKDCVYYGKMCSSWKKAHRGRKPSDYDGVKNGIMDKYPGFIHKNNANTAQRKGDNNNGFNKEKRNHNRDRQS